MRPLPLLARDERGGEEDSGKKGEGAGQEGRAWMAQVRHAVTSLAGLESALELTEEEREGARKAEQAGLPISITPYYLSLADPKDPNCPVRRQCVPTFQESVEIKGDLEDPLGEEAHEITPHLVRRYPDRVLLLATDRCSVYCRFCTRSRMVGAGGGVRSLDHLASSLDWIAQNEEIRDVIVSGGDPLIMTTERLTGLMAKIREIPHIDTIRLATRAPVTLPHRVTEELVEALREFHPIWVMTHFNHPKELTELSRRAVERFADAGFPVMNQTVLLRGINDDPATLETLFRCLIRSRVRPYYLLQADPVKGTGHLRTSIDTGIAIMEQLQGRLTGIALPKYIVDTPGGMGKVPIGPDWIVRRGEEGETVLRTHRGALVSYFDPVQG